MTSATVTPAAGLAAQIQEWGRALGFDRIGIADTDLSAVEPRFQAWLAAGYQGDMDYLARHGTRRSRPAELVPGTRRIILARMDYLTRPPAALRHTLADPERASLAVYALGRDYHKVLRQRLQRLADRIQAAIGPFSYRVFVDSAPVLEKPLAVRAGLGWIGRHTNLVHPRAGSWCVLGAIYTDLELPVAAPLPDRCGRCRRCLDACPTGAIVAPYVLDARRCIAYLTIEHRGAIPVALRPLLGNRIFGCDDCQRVCPWNRFARLTPEAEFQPRHGLDRARLTELFAWDETAFLRRTEGMAIRRLGHERWLRNLAVALGNGPPCPAHLAALRARAGHPSALVREHVAWALERLAQSGAARFLDPCQGTGSARCPDYDATADPDTSVTTAMNTTMNTAIADAFTLDHRRCDRLLAAVETQLGQGDWLATGAAATALIAAMERHFVMEEDEVFPALARIYLATEQPIEVMRGEHAQLRQLFRELDAAVAGHDAPTCRGLLETLHFLVQQHNYKEEGILYPMADGALTAQAPALAARIATV